MAIAKIEQVTPEPELEQIWVEVIIPSRAAEMLASRAPNRNINPDVVRQYAADMKANVWRQTMTPIVLDEFQRLIDGQHRLAAVVQYNKPVEMIVAITKDPNAMDAFDVGKKRSFADYLTIKGVKPPHATAVVVKGMIGLQAMIKGALGGETVTNQVAWKLYSEHDSELWHESVRILQKTGIKRLMAQQPAGVLHMYLSIQGDREESLKFMSKLETGANLMPGNPILAARHTLEKMAFESRGRGTDSSRRSTRGRSLVLVMAWNDWVRGNERRVFKLVNQVFPVPLRSVDTA